jgi:hypothetical protein
MENVSLSDLHELVEFTIKQDPSLNLLETATAQTILHRGTVYAVTPGELPSGCSLGALFRFWNCAQSTQ